MPAGGQAGQPLIFETSSLVDFERENSRGTPGQALALLEVRRC